MIKYELLNIKNKLQAEMWATSFCFHNFQDLANILLASISVHIAASTSVLFQSFSRSAFPEYYHEHCHSAGHLDPFLLFPCPVVGGSWVTCVAASVSSSVPSMLPVMSLQVVFLLKISPSSSASLIYLSGSLQHSFFTQSSFILVRFILPPTGVFPLQVFYIPLTALTSFTFLRSSCCTYSVPVFLLPLISASQCQCTQAKPSPMSLF